MTFKDLLAGIPEQHLRGLNELEARYKKLPKACKDAVVDFKRDVCQRSKEIDPNEELDWSSLSLGYLAAKGIYGDNALEVASMLRYNFQYWC